MQRAKFTVGIPPAMGKVREFGEFCWIGIDVGVHDVIIASAIKNRAEARFLDQ